MTIIMVFHVQKGFKRAKSIVRGKILFQPTEQQCAAAAAAAGRFRASSNGTSTFSGVLLHLFIYLFILTWCTWLIFFFSFESGKT